VHADDEAGSREEEGKGALHLHRYTRGG
jgi:hypothetical protein